MGEERSDNDGAAIVLRECVSCEKERERGATTPPVAIGRRDERRSAGMCVGKFRRRLRLFMERLAPFSQCRHTSMSSVSLRRGRINGIFAAIRGCVCALGKRGEIQFWEFRDCTHARSNSGRV